MNQAHAAEVFRALSVPNRMHILMLLKAKGPLPVKTIAETLELTSPAVSQHLKRSEERRVGKECRSRWSP